MRRLSLAILLSMIFSHSSFAAELEKDAVQCPTLSVKDLNLLTPDRMLKNGLHMWYLHDMFDLPESLGNHIPLDLSVTDVLTTKEIEFKGQLDGHTCQYKAILGNDRHANLTFRLVGN